VAAKGCQPFDGFGIPPESGEAASIEFRSLFGFLRWHWKLVSIFPLLALMISAVAWLPRLLPQPSVRSTSDAGAIGNLNKPDE
jgi:hypothetical protein